MPAGPTGAMRWIPGGTFAMGSEDFYPEERPVHRVAVDGFWMDEQPVTGGRVPPLRARDRLRHGRRAPARPGGLPGRRPGAARPGLARLPQDARARSTCDDYRNWWEYVPGAYWQRPGGTGHDDQRPRPPPGRPRRLRGRRGVRGLGRARSCRPRPSGSSPRAAGSRAPSSPGATSTSRTASRWRTPGRASSPGRT